MTLRKPPNGIIVMMKILPSLEQQRNTRAPEAEEPCFDLAGACRNMIAACTRTEK